MIDNTEEKKSINLLIVLMPDGTIGVNGPLENKVLCYGLLESARDAIKDYKPKIQIPGDYTNDLLRRKN